MSRSYVRAEDDVTFPTARHGGGGFTALPTRHHAGGRGGSGRDDIDDDAKYNDAAKFRTGTSFDAGRSALVLNPGRDMRLRAGDLCFLVCLNDHTYSIKKACESGDLPPLKPSAGQSQAQREQGGAGRDAKDHGAGTSPGARRRHGAPNGPANGSANGPANGHTPAWQHPPMPPCGRTPSRRRPVTRCRPQHHTASPPAQRQGPARRLPTEAAPPARWPRWCCRGSRLPRPPARLSVAATCPRPASSAGTASTWELATPTHLRYQTVAAPVPTPVPTPVGVQRSL